MVDISILIRKIAFNILHPVWIIFDFLMPKRRDYWAFSTHHLHSGRFIENQRAVFECVKADPHIKKIVFFRGHKKDFFIEGAANYKVVEHGSLRGLILLSRCKVIFITHSIPMDFSLRWGGKAFSILKVTFFRRLVINLWHGIPLKKLLYTANTETLLHTDRIKSRRDERERYAGLIASSDIDSYAMASMFYPLNYRQIWITGLPRNDFLACDEMDLPRYILDSVSLIREAKRGRKLVLYAPTYRQTDVSSRAYYYQFNDHEISYLKKVLSDNNAILGFRPHYFKNSKEYFNFDKYIDNDLIFDFSQNVVHEIAATIRECSVLVTDYSSVYLDALYLGKPSLCFAYDLEQYKQEQDGLLYDLSLVFLGQIHVCFLEVVKSIADILSALRTEQIDTSSAVDKIFFNYHDSYNSRRVVDNVKKSLTK